jgi:hypothetical protein
MWYVYKRVILTKDNLAKRNWKGNKQCIFCCKDENIQHLFFECYYAKFLWGLISLLVSCHHTILIICLVLGPMA